MPTNSQKLGLRNAQMVNASQRLRRRTNSSGSMKCKLAGFASQNTTSDSPRSTISSLMFANTSAAAGGAQPRLSLRLIANT